jgi:bacillithiol biosynthesis cysteine-adding enzyme BshC
MEPYCVRQTQIPGTSRLFADFLYNFPAVSRFFPYSYLESERIPELAAKLDYPDARRAELVRALSRQNGDLPALKKLSQPGCVAVVTGQQVGLFSGPAYTIFKALTAVKLAAQLEEQGTPAVPVFWCATEDHDLAEVDHAWLFDQMARPEKVSITNSVVAGGPVGAIELNAIPVEEVRKALGDLPFAQDVIDRLVGAYRPGMTLGQAFQAFLRDVLASFPLVFIDPLHPEIRQIAAPLLREAADRVPELVADVQERNNELAKAGYHAQVLVEDDTSLLFLLGDRRRVPIRFTDGAFATKDARFSAAELGSHATALSPNALLRPVMQDFLLPTVAYVGGPAEIAYMAQSAVLYERLLGRMPVIYPRNSFTLLDHRAAKLMQRYEIAVPDLLEHQEHVKSRIAARLVPENLAERFGALEQSAKSSLDQLRRDLVQFDPTLAAATSKSTAKVLHQIRRLAAKTARETLRRDEQATGNTNYLTNLIYPHRHLQERLYSIVPFLAKHGLDLPGRLLEVTQLTCHDHMVRTL